MDNSNDHDLLIALNTKVETLLQQHAESVRNSNAIASELVRRVTTLEAKDSRDSEKVRAISADVQRSLDNRAKIDDMAIYNAALKERVDNLEDELSILRGKSNLWDIGNSVAVAIAGLIGYFR